MKAFVLSAAVLSASALADTQIYGSIQSGITFSKTDTATQKHTATSISDLGSHIGIRGSYPIGGNRLIWQFEQDTPVGNGSMREYFRNKKETARSGK